VHPPNCQIAEHGMIRDTPDHTTGRMRAGRVS
jgi:hypothetical protein